MKRLKLTQRVLIKDSVYKSLNETIANVTHTDINDIGEVILCLDVPHPEDKNAFLWVNISEVEII